MTPPPPGQQATAERHAALTKNATPGGYGRCPMCGEISCQRGGEVPAIRSPPPRTRPGCTSSPAGSSASPDLAERLRHVFIENTDGLAVIERYGADPTACVYVDPPYLRSTRSAPTCYRHEFQEDHQHRELAEVCHGSKAAVVLSGYPSALYDEDLYAGWHRIERSITLRAGNGRKTSLGEVVEVLWSNRPFTDEPAAIHLTLFDEEAS